MAPCINTEFIFTFEITLETLEITSLEYSAFAYLTVQSGQITTWLWMRKTGTFLPIAKDAALHHVSVHCPVITKNFLWIAFFPFGCPAAFSDVSAWL